MPIIISLSTSTAENQKRRLGNGGMKGTLGNKRERARRIKEFFAWEFSEEDIKGIFTFKLSLNKDRSEILDQTPVNIRYVLYVI